MNDHFESAWLKCGWAVVESNRLQLDINAFMDDLKGKEFGRVGADYQPKYHRFAVILDAVNAEFPKRWGLRVGNIDNFIDDSSCVQTDVAALEPLDLQKGAGGRRLPMRPPQPSAFRVGQTRGDLREVLEPGRAPQLSFPPSSPREKPAQTG